MVIKKRKIKKNVIFIISFICIFILYFWGNRFILINFRGDKIKANFVSLGYNKSEAKLLLNKLPSNNYNLLNDYDESIIDLVSYKDYNPKLFSKYYEYYLKNKKSDIKNIIVIVNSGYDLMKYPASDLLSSLVLEKYYINKNVARYLDYGNTNKVTSKEVVAIVNSKADLDYYKNVKSSSLEDGNLILVNKFYYLSENYVPKDLVTLSSKYNIGSNDKMRKEAANAFMKMVDAALLDNIILKNASAYRSYEYQDNLYDSYVERDGKKKADIYSARPGFSEHQTGLCTDINTIDSSFHDTDEAKWLLNNSYKYGFIIRFPKDKEKITGYKYEPWHYRYVGKKVAKIIFENDLTLEEYYAFYLDNDKGL